MRSEHHQATTTMKLLFLSSLVVFLCMAPCALAQNDTTEAVDGAGAGGGGGDGGGDGAMDAVDGTTQESNLVTEEEEEGAENVTQFIPSRPVIVADEEPPVQVVDNETIVSEDACPQGMYGRQCMYKCQCENYKCDNEGFCQSGAKCVKSRFGDRCQESNMVADSIREGITLLDGNMGTCLSEGSFETTVEFGEALPISFIRIMYKNKVENEEFKVFSFKLMGRALKSHGGGTSDDAKKPDTTPPMGGGPGMGSSATTAGEAIDAPIDEEENPTSLDAGNISFRTTTPHYTTTTTHLIEETTLPGNGTVVRKRDMDANATAVDGGSGNDTIANSGNFTEAADLPSSSTIEDSNSTTASTTTLPPVAEIAPPDAKGGVCKVEEPDRPEELDKGIMSIDYGKEHITVELNQSVLVSGLTISGDNLANLCELYASGGVDFGPRGVFFERRTGYTRPVTLHDRIYERDDCVKGSGESIFPEIVFDSNASFILVHVELELDWDYPNTAKKGSISVSNEDMSIFWKIQVCEKRKIILGEPYPRKSINQITIRGDNFLPPLCAVYVYGICSPGYYGRDCEQRCSPYCSPDGCDPGTGECRACAIGYFGTMCEKTCPPGCKEGSRCHRYQGTCMEGCSPGKFPPSTCDFSCSPGCAENGECDEVSRECKFGCKVGHFRKSCDMECKGCTGDGSCDIETGRCSAGCIQGYYGEDCKLKCASDCEAGCLMLTGVCTSCPPGKTGDLCNEACNNCAGDGRCHQKDRTCTHGCLPGFKGVYCSEESGFAAAYLSERPENLMMVGVVIAVGLVLLAVVIVAGVCTMKKKPEPQKKQSLPGNFGGMDKVSISPPAQTPKEFNISYEPIKDEYGTLV